MSLGMTTPLLFVQRLRGVHGPRPRPSATEVGKSRTRARGVAIDAVTGAWYGLNPGSATVTLSRVGGSDTDADAIRIAVLKKIAPRLGGPFMRLGAVGPGPRAD